MDIAKYIDHTILKADAKEADIIKLCNEAKEYGFASVCTNSGYTKHVYENLKNSEVKVCTVVGFPLGSMDTDAKVFETKRAIELGSDEIDMVINIGYIKDKKYENVKADIESVVEAAKGRVVKVILETCLLTEEEIIKACKLSLEAGANFVKTSTGFSSGGATIENVKLMKKVVGKKAKVKASGGVRNYETAMQMIKAGADRIGTSSGIAIVKGIEGTGY